VRPGTAQVAESVRDAQLIAQAKAVGLTLLWSGLGSAVMFKIVDMAVGARAPTSSRPASTSPNTASAATVTPRYPRRIQAGATLWR
jgi:ammonia channel protein AmtB